MACDIKSRLIDTLKDEIKGKATSYSIEKDRVFIPFNPKSEFIKTLDQAVKIAIDKVAKINAKYKQWSNGDVVSTDTTPKNGVYINIHPTQSLIDAYEIDEERKLAEETEAEELYRKSQEISDEEVEERIKKCK